MAKSKTNTRTFPQSKPSEDTVVSGVAEDVLEEVVEVEVEEPTVDEPVVEEPVVLAPVPETVYTFLASRHRGFNEGNAAPVVKNIVNKMEQYCVTMNPSAPVDTTVGGGSQNRLFQTIMLAINAAGDSSVAIDAILYYMHKHSTTTFSGRHAFRFLNNTRLDPKSRMLLERLINLFTAIANPATRRAELKKINVHGIVELLPDLNGKNNLLAFITA